jgi:hypothetical protein
MKFAFTESRKLSRNLWWVMSVEHIESERPTDCECYAHVRARGAGGRAFDAHARS